MPHILASKDVIGLANTGTGKTGAFVLPLIQKMLARPQERVLILVPTRELGQQIRNEIFEFSHNMRLFSTLCIGGMNIDFQIQRLRRDPHFIIGTPGRLKDLIERGELKLDKVKNVVLDEADRMVDMGFIQDITHILSKLPTQRQSLFFSATMDKQIQPIVNRFLNDPITVSVVKQKTSENVDQDVIRVPLGKDKIDILHELLEKNEVQKALIFGKTKRGVDSLSWKLNKRGLKTAAIHGDKPQRKRDQALRLFKQDAIDFLVATDVAARGIDVPDISHVINFDQPSTYDDYVHRIGRTGRGDKKGIALTFV
jgi:superfamily II DNA/RNA helicase